MHGVPAGARLPWPQLPLAQYSPVVQSEPSSHAAPSLVYVWTQFPVDVSQLTDPVQPGSRLMLQLLLWSKTQLLDESHLSIVHALPSASQLCPAWVGSGISVQTASSPLVPPGLHVI